MRRSWGLRVGVLVTGMALLAAPALAHDHRAPKATLRDVTFTDCRLDLSAWRFAEFKDVRFTGCNLVGADFVEAGLTSAQFVDCDLSGAQFSHARMNGARFAGCTLDGVGGIADWRGVMIRPTDVIALAHTLAEALGISIEEA